MIDFLHSQNSGPEIDANHQSSGRLLMQVKGLRKSFGGQTVLDGVDLELREGEVVLLCGENGSGKTTLLNILTGNMEPDAGDICLFVNSHPEHFSFPRRWWQELNPWDHFTPERVASEGVGRTWQDTRLFSSQTLLDNLAVARPSQPGEKPWWILAHPRTWKKAEAANLHAAQGLLETLGLGDRCNSSADMISLGQAKRIAFARCAHANTKVIFLDEPLAGLDQKGTENVIGFLRDLAVAHRLTLVIVEHVFNISVILDFAATVWTLADGRLTRETVAAAKAAPAVQAASILPAIICQMVNSDAIVTEESLPRGAMLTRVTRPGILREPLLTIQKLIAYRGHRLVVGEKKNDSVEGFNLTIHKGELVFLQAPNGWGKTSMLEALAGILPCWDGSIQLDGTPLERTTIWGRRLSGLMVIPARDNVFNSLTTAEFQRISAGPLPQFTFSTDSNSMPDVDSRMISSLSGGERKRLVMVTANNQNAKVKIWDEPFASLDAKSTVNCCQNLAPDANTAVLILVPNTHSATAKPTATHSQC